MRDKDITGVAGFWAAAARDAGRNFPHQLVVRALSSLPDVRIWAVSEDSSALFALLADGFSSAHVGRIQVNRGWRTAWSTRWVFSYRGEREGRDAWQHIIGSVVLDRGRGERLDEREKFTRNCFNGWVERQRLT